jgi:hypothetical protein
MAVSSAGFTGQHRGSAPLPRLFSILTGMPCGYWTASAASISLCSFCRTMSACVRGAGQRFD